jgi:hypothetical protein
MLVDSFLFRRPEVGWENHPRERLMGWVAFRSETEREGALERLGVAGGH